MKRIIIAALAIIACVSPARADIPVVSVPFSVTTTGAVAQMSLSGQSICAITFTSVGTSPSVTIQGAADQVPTFSSLATFGSSGVVTPTVGTISGSVGSALTYIRINVTALTGTLAGTLTCSPVTNLATVNAPGYGVCLITTANATTCLSITTGAARYLIGVSNDSTTAQTATLTCYDNATAASGTVVASIAALGATQIITWPPPGRGLLNGLTCIASSAPTAVGIEVYVR